MGVDCAPFPYLRSALTQTFFNRLLERTTGVFV
jgi:hypothetical protein